MKIPTAAITMAALASFLSTAAANAWCDTNGLEPSLREKYEVYADGVHGEIPAVCGGLWHYLDRFGSCEALTSVSCGAGPNGRLEWKFNAPLGCNGGMVESSWWEATHNRFGG